MAMSTGSRAAIVILRALSFILLLISLIVLTTNTETLYVAFDTIKIHFNDIYAYRYMISAIVIGFVYSVIQLVLSVCHALKGHGHRGDGGLRFDFYGDSIIAYLLATGAAAGFGVTKDLKTAYELAGIDLGNKFYDQATASASVLLLAFFCTAILSFIAANGLPKYV
ncbi:hypothetical protein CJ030_MR3G014694 [Morella rubra]|uniref:CASP-like protein n=1 Tax=Morella rubra TaxID=262757 RepID=A0A6A1W0Q0_9ROSI|nr:hypothetical protein CJ030_MR3G014694 [Morella rubra]